MSAKIYYLRPFQRENLDEAAAQPDAQAEAEQPAVVPQTVARRPSRNPLPGGKNSKWKRKLGGGAVRRDAATDSTDEPPKE